MLLALTLHLHPLSPFLSSFSNAIDVQGGLFKAEEDGVSLSAVSASDCAVTISLENVMQAVLVCPHKVWKAPGHSQQQMPFHSLALPPDFTHFQCAMCVFLSHAVSHSGTLLRHRILQLSRIKKGLIRKRDLKQL